MPMTDADYDMTTNGEMEMVWAAMGVPRDGRPFTFFDVGCNHGTWTDIVRAQKQPYRGWLFDINPAMIDFCDDKYALDPDIDIIHRALSNEPGTVPWKDFGAYDGLNTLIDTMDFWDSQIGGSTIRSVEAITGDQFVAQYNIGHLDMVKIDCEGWDWNVLQGLDETISNHRVSVIQWEYGFTTADLHVVMRDFWKFFNDRGYVVGPLRKNGVAFQPFSYAFNQFDSGPNFVAALPQIVGEKAP